MVTRILIVEDDFISREYLHAIISPFGQCHFAVNGAEALEAYKMAWEDGEPYKLICLDVMLPEIDGFQVLKEIRGIEEKKHLTPGSRATIVMISALSDPRLIERALAENSQAYIKKPFTKQEFLDTLQNLNLIQQ